MKNQHMSFPTQDMTQKEVLLHFYFSITFNNLVKNRCNVAASKIKALSIYLLSFVIKIVTTSTDKNQ